MFAPWELEVMFDINSEVWQVMPSEDCRPFTILTWGAKLCRLVTLKTNIVNLSLWQHWPRHTQTPDMVTREKEIEEVVLDEINIVEIFWRWTAHCSVLSKQANVCNGSGLGQGGKAGAENRKSKWHRFSPQVWSLKYVQTTIYQTLKLPPKLLRVFS